MNEYISKHEAYTIMKDLEASYIYPPVKEAYATAARRIDQIRPADVQPVKHGRWIDCTFYDPCEKSWEQEYEFKCSNCGHKIDNKPNDDNLFCGHCGARMDLKE